MWTSKRRWYQERWNAPPKAIARRRRASGPLSADDLVISVTPVHGIYRKLIRGDVIWKILDKHTGRVIAKGYGSTLGLTWLQAEVVFRELTRP